MAATEFDDGYLALKSLALGNRQLRRVEKRSWARCDGKKTVVLAGYSFTGMKIAGRDVKTWSRW